MANVILRKKAKWLSRRGLLELDILLSRFVGSSVFESLTDQELSTYLQILDWQDHDFLQIIQGIKFVNDRNKINIVNKIKSCSRI